MFQAERGAECKPSIPSEPPRTSPHRPLVPPRGDSFEAQRAPREGTFSGESVRGRFSRSLTASSSNYLRRHGLLICPGDYPGQIKKFHLCDLSDSAVKAIYFVLPLIGDLEYVLSSRFFNPQSTIRNPQFSMGPFSSVTLGP